MPFPQRKREKPAKRSHEAKKTAAPDKDATASTEKKSSRKDTK